MESPNSTKDFFATEHSSKTCTGFNPRKVYMLGEKYSGLKPRGELQSYNQLKEYHLRKGTLFEDSQFSPDNIRMSDKWENMKNYIQWLRPKEITENAKFITEGEDRFDINQGQLGDCWFLAALVDVIANHRLMELIVPEDQMMYENYAGIFHFRFWQYGRWIDVVVDDRLPTYQGKLIYLKSQQPNEFWTALLEKAYAKLYGSYKNIEGGLISEALQDLTGGLTEIYEELLKLNTTYNFFDMMLTSYMKQSFMGCAITNSNVVEGQTSNGLYTRHAYSITGVTQVRDKDENNTFRLIRIRNPWGQFEWKGNWSDNSHTWNLIGEEAREEMLVRKDDGEFWMQFEDFISTYTLLEFCHPNPASLRTAQEEMRHWKSFMIDGAWVAKVTCGGVPGHRYFSKNPQYLLSVNGLEKNKTYRIIIGLMQKNRRIYNLPELPIGFVVYQLISTTAEVRRVSKDFLTSRKPIYFRGMQTVKQITGHVDLPNGTYCIIPFTEDRNTNGEFLLRVYAEVPFNVTDNDEEVGMMTSNKVLNSMKASQNADVAIREVFKSISGKYEQIGWLELKKILDLLVKNDKQEFSKEICRSMVAMMDTDRSGKLNFHEFYQLWEKIGSWMGIFRNYDLDQSGSVSGPELRQAFKDGDIQVNNRILNMLMLRYGNEAGEMVKEDFLHCCIKLTTMIQIYEENYSEKEKLENWLIDTVYT